MKPRIAFFGSSLTSTYWNGVATYYRGLIRALVARGFHVVRRSLRTSPCSNRSAPFGWAARRNVEFWRITRTRSAPFSWTLYSTIE